MEKNYAYEEEYEEEGLTLKKVGHFFKVGWLRMIVYAVVLLAIAAVIVLPIKQYYKSKEVARTTIEFTYSGIENGRNPQGGTFDSNNIISQSVLSSAVKESALENVVEDIATLRASMTVEGVDTDEYVKLSAAAASGDSDAQAALRTYIMRPTKFNIVITEPAKLGLSDEQAKLLLDNVVKAYYKDFVKRYADDDPFGSYQYNLSEQATFDFADIYDVYSSRLTTVSDYLTTLYNKLNKMSATEYKGRVDQIRNDILILNISYVQFNSYILSNSIWHDRDAAKQSLTVTKKSYEDMRAAKIEYRDKLEEQLKEFQPNTTISNTSAGSTTTVSYSSAYYVYHEKFDEANRQIEDYTNHIDNITAHLINLEGSSSATEQSKIDKATELLKDMETQSTKVVDAVKELVKDYNESLFVAEAVNQIQSPIVTRSSLNFNVMIIFVVVAIVGVLAATFVTLSKISAANKAKEEKAAAQPKGDKE